MWKWLKEFVNRMNDKETYEQRLMRQDFEMAMKQTDPVERDKWLSGHYSFKT